jgi:hypothetical protein
MSNHARKNQGYENEDRVTALSSLPVGKQETNNVTRSASLAPLPVT